MNKIIIANWKLNPQTAEDAVSLAKSIDYEDLVIAPPFPFVSAISKILKKASLGAQDLFWEEAGAFTGEVSGSQLRDLGVNHVIVGHSERRRHLGETDEMVEKKFFAALKNGLVPILCVGETKAEREAGETKEVIGEQLKFFPKVLKKAAPQSVIIVAYEPVWAIGTGIADSPEETLKVMEFINKRVLISSVIRVKRIYGGSVTSSNADDFLKHKEIDGALVGGASLRREEMETILKIAKKYE